VARYALPRLLLILPALLLVFAIVRAVPGDAVDMMLEPFQYGRDAEELRARSVGAQHRERECGDALRDLREPRLRGNRK
jgi:ABC-type microcin C transport system permease subunit YejB